MFFWHRERPGPRVLTKGLAGVEPLWAEHHTVRVEKGVGWESGRGWGRTGMGAGLPSDMTLSNESGTNTYCGPFKQLILR